MIRLSGSLNAWGSADFKTVLKAEIERLDPGLLPLQQGLSNSSYATDSPHTAVIIAVSEAPGLIRAKLGIFYAGIIAGCSCADDPTPVEEQTEYCELRIDIDTTTAEASMTLLADED